MSFDHVLYEGSSDTRTVTITVNRPDKLNALNAAVFDDIEAAFERARTDAGCDVVIVTGAGARAFVAGADIAELAEQDSLAAEQNSRRGQNVFRKVELLGKPVIGMLNGHALGGGLELALACHLRTMSESAKLGVPEVGLGLLPGYGATQRLPRLVGRVRALEMLLGGNPIDAATALSFGLVNRVVPAAELREATEALAASILRRGPLGVRAALEAAILGSEVSFDAGLLIESRLFGRIFATEDKQEGTSAFLEKRKPNFRGT